MNTLRIRHGGGGGSGIARDRGRSATAVLVGLAARAAAISLLQSAGIVLIARASPWALLTAFLISWQWASNSRAVVDYRIRGSRTAYAVGGCCGTALTLAVAWWMG
jgi:hypothetical protein